MSAGSRLVGTSSSERTLDERELSSLRPAKQNAPRPRKPTVLREVTKGIACFCGERFGEHQALEFMLHLRAEVGDDLAYLEGIRSYRKARWEQIRQNPQRAAQERARVAESARRRRSDPEARERENARRRSRRRSDPEYRERQNARVRAADRRRRARKKSEREAEKS